MLTFLTSRIGRTRPCLDGRHSKPADRPFVRRLPGPRTLVRWAFDRLDERQARRLRKRFGTRRWLLSWQREADGRWRARLSCPALPHTLERVAETRSRAILRAETGLMRILSYWGERAVPLASAVADHEDR